MDQKQQEIAGLRDVISKNQTRNQETVTRINGVAAQLKSRQRDLDRARDTKEEIDGGLSLNDLVTELESIASDISAPKESEESETTDRSVRDESSR
jgi:hypothetical protein